MNSTTTAFKVCTNTNIVSTSLLVVSALSIVLSLYTYSFFKDAVRPSFVGKKQILNVCRVEGIASSWVFLNVASRTILCSGISYLQFDSLCPVLGAIFEFSFVSIYLTLCSLLHEATQLFSIQKGFSKKISSGTTFSIRNYTIAGINIASFCVALLLLIFGQLGFSDFTHFDPLGFCSIKSPPPVAVIVLMTFPPVLCIFLLLKFLRAICLSRKVLPAKIWIEIQKKLWPIVILFSVPWTSFSLLRFSIWI